MTAVPHFRVPFRVGPTGSALVVEQDSAEDLVQCVTAIVKTPLGTRIEVPDFGLSDPTFRVPDSLAGAAIAQQIETWEPRVSASVDLLPSRNNPSTATMRIAISAASDVRPSDDLTAPAISVLPPDTGGPLVPDPGASNSWGSLGSLTWNGSGDLAWNTI